MSVNPTKTTNTITETDPNEKIRNFKPDGASSTSYALDATDLGGIYCENYARLDLDSVNFNGTLKTKGQEVVTKNISTAATSLAAGSAPTVTYSGSTNKFTFGIPKGDKGATGATGATGASSEWYTGTGVTGTSTTAAVFSSSGVTSATVGDMYLNTSTYNVYRCTTAGAASSAKWAYTCNIKGATGATGAAAGFGTPTATVDTNIGTPSVTITSSGSNTSKVFNFAFKNLKGATGATGATGASSEWYTGTGVTGTSTTATVFSSSGVTSATVGDMYLNTSTYNTYKCTTAGAASAAKWVYVCNIKGATGTAAGFGTPTATIDANVGTPSVTVTSSGSNTSKVFNFAFKNLKGNPGKDGSNGSNGTSAEWYTGTGITGTSTTATAFSSSGVSAATIGDMYLNTSTSNVYRCTVAGNASSAKWVYTCNIKGQKGNDAVYDIANSTTAGIVKSGEDIIVNSDGTMTVKDNSHNHNNYAYKGTLTSENLNSVTEPGFYSAVGGNTCTNKPSNIDYFGLIVVHNASGSYYTQILTSTKSYRRYCINGTWGDWTEDKLTDTTYSVATDSKLGLIKADTSGDINISTTGVVTVKDDSHNHVILNIDGLQTALNTKANLSGATFTGNITAPYIGTSNSNDSYFQARKFRGQGAASSYYHAIDFGYAGHDQIDFYEYGGLYNFWMSSYGNTDDAILLGKINKNGWEGNVTGNVTGNADTATKATQDASGNVITETYATKTELPTKTSDLTNDSGFIIKSVNNLDNYYDKDEINTELNGKSDSDHTHTLTPTGSVTSTFTGTAATLSKSYTPVGKISTVVTDVTTSSTTVNSITSVGTLPSLTHSYDSDDRKLTLTFERGLSPTYSSKTVLTSISSTKAAPTFTGTAATISMSYTPAGTVKSTFKGTQGTTSVGS